jgi:hypothetical protein
MAERAEGNRAPSEPFTAWAGRPSLPKFPRLIAVRGLRFEACDKPLLSEGRGREFESRRVRHKFNDLNGFCSFCVPVVSRPRACIVRSCAAPNPNALEPRLGERSPA